MSSGGPTAAGWADLVSLLLDTTVLIDVLRGKPAAERLLRLRSAGQVPCVCAVNIEEVWRGVRPDEEEVTSLFLDALRPARLGQAEGRRAGIWRRDFAARGVTLSQADCLIAAAALGAGVPLATGNPGDFPMEELTVEHWTVGA